MLNDSSSPPFQIRGDSVRLMLISIITLTSLISCTESPESRLIRHSKSTLPMSPGSWWKLVEDTSSVEFRVIGIERIDGVPCAKFNMRFFDGKHLRGEYSEYYSIDTAQDKRVMKVINISESNQRERMFNGLNVLNHTAWDWFAFDQGKHSSIGYASTRLYVDPYLIRHLGVFTIKTPAGEFSNCYDFITERLGVADDGEQTSIAPGIGFIRWSILGDAPQEYLLESYHVE